MNKNDLLLAVWILSALTWDILVFATTTYLVFWRGHSGWWFILAVLLAGQSTLFKALRKRFDIKEE